MAEALQQLILDSLQSGGSINDTRSLILPDKAQPAESLEDQITILGALNSLSSREVIIRLLSCHPTFFIYKSF